MRRSLTAVLLATSMFILPSEAHAQAMSAEEAAALRAELAALKAKVDVLEARLDAATAESGSAAPSAPPAPEQAVAAAPEKPATEVHWKGAPEIKSADGWSFKPRGRIQVDAAYVAAPDAISDPALGFSNELRRVRMGFGGTMPGGFGYKVEADFAGGEADLLDAFLTYGKGPLTVTVGQHNPCQGLEELSSSNDTSFIERAAFTDAFNFIRRVGVSGQYTTGPVLIEAGLFTDNYNALDSGNNGYSADGRVVYAPKIGDTQLHFGASAHYRRVGDTVRAVRYRQRPLVHSADIRFISTPSIDARSETGLGLETAFIRGRLHGMGEAYWQNVGRTGLADPTFFGGAVEVGYFLTDDTRSYKGGIFKEVKVSHPVGEGGIGAVEFNVRSDRLDLNDAGIVGGTQDGYMASLIWNPVDYLRFMINYAHLYYHDAVIPAGTDRDYGVDTVGARAQVVF